MTKRYNNRVAMSPPRVDPDLKERFKQLSIDTGMSQNQIYTIIIENVLGVYYEPKVKRSLWERFKK